MDLSKLAPSDAVVALRSMERRYRALFAEDEDAPDDLASREAGNGWTALEHIVAAAWDIAASGRGLNLVLTEELPLLDPVDVDPAARPHPQRPSGTVHERLAELGLEAGVLADRAEHVDPADWERLGTLNDGSGRRVSALDVLRAAVDSGITHLKAAEYVLDEVRKQS